MDLPVMNLCAENKRNLRSLWMFGKTKNSTMFEKGGLVIQPPSDCQTELMDNKNTKFHSLFSRSYNQSSFITSFSVVGGFLGSKSQVRSTNFHDQCVWDFIKFAENLYSAASINIISESQIPSSSVPSPPKKKFAKDSLLSESGNSSSFPSVGRRGSDQETKVVDGPKQSYAEVARSVCSRSSGLQVPNQPAVSINPRSKREICSPRRSHSIQLKNNCRKRNRKDKSHSFVESECGRISDSALKVEISKDSRGSSAHNLHYSSINHTGGSRKYFKHSLIRKDQQDPDSRQALASVRRDRRPNVKSGGGRKHTAKSRSNYCDIEMVNWRTGEPIKPIMQGVDVSDISRNERPVTLPEEMSSEHSGGCVNEDRKHSGQFADASCPELQHPYTCNRRRSFSSECSVDSEDSFIVFQSGTASDSSLSDVSGDWSDMDSENSFGDDSDSLSDFDDCEGCNLPSSQRLQEVNMKWLSDCAALSESTALSNLPCTKNSVKGKKVQFTSSKPKVHWMLTWDYAYRTSRVGPWEEMARDRSRFQSRIQQFEDLLAPVLAVDHRNKIWKQLHSSS